MVCCTSTSTFPRLSLLENVFFLLEWSLPSTIPTFPCSPVACCVLWVPTCTYRWESHPASAVKHAKACTVARGQGQVNHICLHQRPSERFPRSNMVTLFALTRPLHTTEQRRQETECWEWGLSLTSCPGRTPWWLEWSRRIELSTAKLTHKHQWLGIGGPQVELLYHKLPVLAK